MKKIVILGTISFGVLWLMFGGLPWQNSLLLYAVCLGWGYLVKELQ